MINGNKKGEFIGSKKALSPLVATVLLVVFALVVGTITMNWGKSYVNQLKDEPAESKAGKTVILTSEEIDDPLKELQIQYITGEIDKNQYIEKQKSLVSG